MSVRHTCTCELTKSIDGGPIESAGSLAFDQIGTYETAKDSCDAVRDAYTYTSTKDGRTEKYHAACELD